MGTAVYLKNLWIEPLFQILDLFAHLLDENFHFHRAARDFRVDRFRTQGIGLAVEFLHQKIQSLAHRAALLEYAVHLCKMTG